MKNTFLLVLLVFCIGCQEQAVKKISKAKVPLSSSAREKEEQEEIIEEYLYGCASKYPLYSAERQHCLDEGLKIDPNIAYLWQQKAMPLFKQGKYEVGMDYIDKAVEIDPERWQPYRAFIKVIFAKTYRAGLADFKDLLEKYGNSYVMDHTYKFHMALSHLQLNEFKEAEKIFSEDLKEQREQWGENGEHHLDLFYYGISKYEQGKWKEAITQFDRALGIYPTFAEVQYYKAVCLIKLDRQTEAIALIDKAEKNGRAGNTINEDNVVYERYPYQVRW